MYNNHCVCVCNFIMHYVFFNIFIVILGLMLTIVGFKILSVVEVVYLGWIGDHIKKEKVKKKKTH